MAKRTFYAAKINIHGNIFSQNLQELIHIYIPNTILESVPIKVNTWNWTFTDVKEVISNDRKIIVGNVTKSKYQNQTVRINTVTKRVKSEHELAYRAFFVYDPIGEILAHESTSSISANEFIYMFKNLLSRNPLIGEVKIVPVPEPFMIRKEILSIEKLTQVNFHLIHPNPGKQEFNLYQRMIKENRLKELDIKMTNKDGLDLSSKETITNVHENKPTFTNAIEDGIALVEAGYGQVEVRGYDEVKIQGKKKELTRKQRRAFSSKRSVRTLKSSERDNSRLLPRIVDFILDVINKHQKEGGNIEG